MEPSGVSPDPIAWKEPETPMVSSDPPPQIFDETALLQIFGML
jgi:hypothetical protein